MWCNLPAQPGSSQIMLLRTVGKCVLNVFTTCLGNLYQCSVTWILKKLFFIFRRNFLCISLCPLPFIPLLGTSELGPIFLIPSLLILLYTLMRSHLSHLFSILIYQLPQPFSFHERNAPVLNHLCSPSLPLRLTPGNPCPSCTEETRTGYITPHEDSPRLSRGIKTSSSGRIVADTNSFRKHRQGSQIYFAEWFSLYLLPELFPECRSYYTKGKGSNTPPFIAQGTIATAAITSQAWRALSKMWCYLELDVTAAFTLSFHISSSMSTLNCSSRKNFL